MRQKPASTSTSGIATIVCDASLKNVLQQEIDVYEYIYPKASIIPYYEDERACFDSLLNLSTKMIVASRSSPIRSNPTSRARTVRSDRSRIAVDALALIVNPANNIDQMSITELAGDSLWQGDRMEQCVAQRRPRTHRGGV